MVCIRRRFGFLLPLGAKLYLARWFSRGLEKYSCPQGFGITTKISLILGDFKRQRGE
jgi:hypothetical protein